MKIIKNDYMPTYSVTFSHPDDSSLNYEFFVDLEGKKSPWTDEEWEEFNKELVNKVWNAYNRSGYYHTMTITASYYFDGEMHKCNVCENASWGDIF